MCYGDGMNHKISLSEPLPGVSIVSFFFFAWPRAYKRNHLAAAPAQPMWARPRCWRKHLSVISSSGVGHGAKNSNISQGEKWYPDDNKNPHLRCQWAMRRAIRGATYGVGVSEAHSGVWSSKTKAYCPALLFRLLLNEACHGAC